MENLVNKRFYKIVDSGIDRGNDVTIEEDELEEAYRLFLLGGRHIFSGGPVDGKNIRTITEDFHSTMNWHEGYKLGSDDYAELNAKGISFQMKKTKDEAQKTVQVLVNAKRPDLIGKPGTLEERLKFLN